MGKVCSLSRIIKLLLHNREILTTMIRLRVYIK